MGQNEIPLVGAGLSHNACIVIIKIIHCSNDPKLACFTKLFTN